mmetsp:Transcript_5686/g.10834  ORF Transcript_5686/g.10834 Transcript_5686/m.10834 type:complete len:82 (+) Transcript_5686:1799-2044(+)
MNRTADTVTMTNAIVVENTTPPSPFSPSLLLLPSPPPSASSSSPPPIRTLSTIATASLSFLQVDPNPRQSDYTVWGNMTLP